MDDLDALLEELERATLDFEDSAEDHPTPVVTKGDYDILPLSRKAEEKQLLPEDRDGSKGSPQRSLPLPSVDPPEKDVGDTVQPVYITQLPKDREDHVYTEVPDPSSPVSPVPTSTAAQKLDELMLSLLNIQSKIQLDDEASKVSEPLLVSPTTTLENMLGTLEEDLKNLGAVVIPKGSCAYCVKPIAGKIITALGKTWHPEHFTCAHCRQEIGPQPFFERDGVPYCQKDHEELFLPRCAYCKAPIANNVLTALNQTWHPEHFFCSHCGTVFEGGGYHEKNGKPYCRKDFLALFAPKCGGCAQPVLDNYFTAMNTIWHPDCFVCGDCFCSFPNGCFYEVNGRPFCELDFHRQQGSICKGCQMPIAGRCINAMGARFHPEHFVCSFCMKQLSQGTFREQKEKPYCQPCFSKLFV